MISIDPFFYWINERHKIYLKKQAGEPWPWTNDKILQDYRFCNVFRELDTVTIWIREHIREPFADHPNLWFLLALARQINWPETLDDILEYSGLPDVWNPAEVRAIMLARQIKMEKVYTGAYMLSGAGAAGHDKPWYTCFHVLDPVYIAGTACPPDFRSLEVAVSWFKQFNGWAGFLSYEVVSDLRWTRYLCNADDVYTWANTGPGARRGLNRIFGRGLEAPIKEDQAVAEMQYLLHLANGWHAPDNVYRRLSGDASREYEIAQHVLGSNPLLRSHITDGEKINGKRIFPIEMREIEHSLCETDKYLRVKLGEGKPRAKYHSVQKGK